MTKEIIWHSLDIKSVLAELNTNLLGLTSEDSVNRLRDYGYNELKAKKKASPIMLLLNQFKSTWNQILMFKLFQIQRL